jgi:hypothetical protein
MDENVLKSADRDENAENKVAPSTAIEPPPESQASDSKLRVVWCDSKLRDLWSPKLDLSEGVADDCARRCRRTVNCIVRGHRTRRVGRTSQPASDATLPRSLRLADPISVNAYQKFSHLTAGTPEKNNYPASRDFVKHLLLA